MTQSMDDLHYEYYPGTNQLKRVNDAVSAGNYAEDINDQGSGNNYTYDAIGNMTSDVAEGISNIDWTVYGKIKSITKANTTISYSYDASGNRISKTVDNKSTVYVRDASGNVMSVYSISPNINNGHLIQEEVHLYGSSRLGIFEVKRDMYQINLVPDNTPGLFERGHKFFELTNHLGNVLVTISDKKLQHLNNSGAVDF